MNSVHYRSDISVDSFQSKFVSFLEKEYGYHKIVPFNCINNADISHLFLAEDAHGQQIIIKQCQLGEICENEYHKNALCYQAAPEYFPKAFAYCSDKEFSFTAQEYKPSKTLKAVLDSNPSDDEKGVFIEDLYNIFIALNKAGVVHRDIHSLNLLVHKGHCILVDFQTAVCSENYQEIISYNTLYKLSQFRGEHHYSMVAWDDASTMLQVLREIGSSASYEIRYQQIENFLESQIGKHTIWYKLPSSFSLILKIYAARFQAWFTPWNKKRCTKYKKQALMYAVFLKHAINKKTRKFPLDNECKKERKQLEEAYQKLQ